VSVYPVNNPESTQVTAAAPAGANRLDTPQASQHPAHPAKAGSQPAVGVAPDDAIPSAAAPIGDAAYMDEPPAVVPPDRLLPAVTPSAAPTDPVHGVATLSSNRISADPAMVETGVPSDKRVGEPLAPADDTRAQIPDKGAPTALAAGSPPLLLGRLQVATGDTIVQLVRQVRGNYDPGYLDSLLALNPHINNPDSIAVDDAITFPATPVRVSPLIHRTHWLQLKETPSLDKAHQAFKTYRKQGLSVHIGPYWTAQTGLWFVVVAAEAFASPQAARLRMETLPADVAAQCDIRSQWGRNPIFFASPF
jgi:hypothetical protein